MEMTRKQVQIPRESICSHYYISTIPSQGVQESACGNHLLQKEHVIPRIFPYKFTVNWLGLVA